MSLIKHKYINKTSKYKLPKTNSRSFKKPINKKIKYSTKDLMGIIEKRYLLISTLMVIFFLVIIGRLFELQVLDTDKYQEKLVISTEKTIEGNSAPRGRIYDRNYKLLVDNQAKKTIYYKKENGVTPKEEIALAYRIGEIVDVDYSNLSDYRLKTFYYINNQEVCKKKISQKEWNLYKLRKLNDVDIQNLIFERITEEELSIYKEKDLEAAYIYYLMNRGYYYTEKIIKNENVTEKEYAMISENISTLHGFNTKLDWERIYLYGDTFKSILGTVSSNTQGIPKELVDDYLKKGYSLDDRVGTSYLEYQYEDYLKGKKPIYKIVNNNYELLHQGKRGNDLVLTIDIDLQKYLENVLSEEVMRAKGEPNTKY